MASATKRHTVALGLHYPPRVPIDASTYFYPFSSLVRVTQHMEDNTLRSRIQLLKKSFTGSDEELEELIQNAVDATVKLQAKLGKESSAILLVET